MAQGTLFERIGGMEDIMAATDIFYDKVVADERTRPFFNGTDMVKQSAKLVGFMAWAFGAESEYKGRDLRTSHRHLVQDQGLNDMHFDAVTTHLKDTLVELGVEAGLIQEALAIVGGTRNEVLNR